MFSTEYKLSDEIRKLSLKAENLEAEVVSLRKKLIEISTLPRYDVKYNIGGGDANIWFEQEQNGGHWVKFPDLRAAMGVYGALCE